MPLHKIRCSIQLAPFGIASFLPALQAPVFNPGQVDDPLLDPPAGHRSPTDYIGRDAHSPRDSALRVCPISA